MKALVLLALLPGAAMAEELAETHFRMNFCYERAFDSAELAAAPDQRVRRIVLDRRPVGTLEKMGELAMEVEVMLRDGSSQFEGLARCRPEMEGLLCSLGRDAGGFGLKAEGNGVALTVGPEGMVFEGWTEQVRLGVEEGPDRSFVLRRCG